MLTELKKLQDLYEKNVNIIGYIKEKTNEKNNTLDMIRVSYDLQAGSYVKKAKKNIEWENEFAQGLADVLNQFSDINTILEAGIGEATTLCNVLSRLKTQPKNIYGFDISYSRIQYAIDYARENGLKNSTLFVGDLFNSAVQDNSIDLVYTSHALEPNGGREKEALMELYRITRRYLVLFEPCYEMADEDTKRFMEKNGYITGLRKFIDELGYKVLEHKLVFSEDKVSVNKNNTSVTIIEKTEKNKNSHDYATPLACPITKSPLELVRHHYFSKESLLLYPVIEDVPCLLPENAIIATHFLDKEKFYG